MKKNYSILILGQFYNNHTIRFVRNLKCVNPQIQIDSFTPRIRGEKAPQDYLDCFRTAEVVNFSNIFKRIPGLREKEAIRNWRKYFRAFVKGRHYDILNIHYPCSFYSYCLPELRAVADTIVLTPWGSDVLRIKEKDRRILQKLYDSADYVTGHGDRFTDDFMRIFNIPNQKFVHEDLGSETIDYIAEYKDTISTDFAKQQLGIDNCYVITCGYNGSAAQQHIHIIDAINRAKDKLPENLVLLFPVTYPSNEKYFSRLKETIEKYGLHAMWFEKYLELDSLMYLRQATDMFIHVQTTDANNASLKEYLLLGKNCINGDWLKYPDVEENGYKPYHVVQNLNNLDSVIIEAYHKGTPNISDAVISHIKSFGCKPAAKKWDEFFMNISK